jgi:hypothetical protein
MNQTLVKNSQRLESIERSPDPDADAMIRVVSLAGL